jgi:hypothetical protein
MSWGLTINNVYLSRVTTKELPDLVDACKQAALDARKRLLTLAASTPHTVDDVEGNKIEWHEYVIGETDRILDQLEEDIIKGYLAQLAKDNPENVTED